MPKVNRTLLNSLTTGLREIPEHLRLDGAYYAETSMNPIKESVKGGACAMGHLIEIYSGSRNAGYEYQMIKELFGDEHNTKIGNFRNWVFKQNDSLRHTLAHIAEDMETYFKGYDDA